MEVINNAVEDQLLHKRDSNDKEVVIRDQNSPDKTEPSIQHLISPGQDGTRNLKSTPSNFNSQDFEQKEGGSKDKSRLTPNSLSLDTIPM